MAKVRPTRIREAIHSLTAILSIAGVPKVSSETFRKAKYDDPSVSSDMLKLLYCTCQLNRQLSGNTILRLEQLSLSIDGSWSDKWILLFIQKQLYSMNYTRRNFYDSSLCNSRELLIALGWLITHSDIINQLKSVTLYSNDTYMYPMTSPVDLLIEDVKKISHQLYIELLEIQEKLKNKETKDLVGIVKKLTWLKGSIDKEYKTICRLKKRIDRFETKIMGCVINDMLLYEVYLLKHPKLMEKRIKELDSYIIFLKNFNVWSNEGRNVFSMWLASVLELTENETHLNVSDLAKEIDTLQLSVLTLQERNKAHLETLVKSLRKHEDSSAHVPSFHHPFTPPINAYYHINKVYCSSTDSIANDDHDRFSELKHTNLHLKNVIHQQLKILQEKVPNNIMTLEFK